MKKSLLFILPLLALTACSGVDGNAIIENVINDNNEASVSTLNSSNLIGEGTFITYLMMSPFGYLDINGVRTNPGDVSERFLNNAIVWQTNPGDALPTASQVKSTVSGATFRGWALYTENVYPEYLSNVPSENGKCVYAIFDGKTGGGGDTPTGDKVTFTINNCPNWISNDGCVIFAWTWGSVHGGWVKTTIEANKTTITLETYNDITGMLLARCAPGTTEPNWNTTGDVAGRVYNQSGDIIVTKGKTTYSCPEWKEYNPSW